MPVRTPELHTAEQLHDGGPRVVPRRCAVVGAGIVGLSIAWELARRGHAVTLIDPAPASGATHAAAGMIAPVSEYHYQEEHLLPLSLHASARYSEFLASLGPEAVTGHRVTGTLVVGVDAADRAALSDLAAAQRANGLNPEDLSTREARRREPLLSPAITAAYAVAGDHQLDPRALAAALLAALRAHPNVRICGATAVELLTQDPAEGEGSEARPLGAVYTDDAEAAAAAPTAPVTGVLLEGGERVWADEVVVANALGASSLIGADLGMRPVYGDILRLRVPEHLRPLVTHTVRGSVRGVPVYLVPRDDHTVVIGATQREDRLAGPSAGGVYQLLRDAQALVPAVAELELLEVTARPRPGTSDNAPLLGRWASRDTHSGESGGVGRGVSSGPDVPGLIIATGFYRHGVMLAPAAASACAALIEGRTSPVDLAPFRPDRFAGSRASAPRRPDSLIPHPETRFTA